MLLSYVSMYLNLQCDFCIFHKLDVACVFIYRTILLSIISLLNEPNTFSPANVDASISFRKWRDSKGKDKEYELIVRYVMLLSRGIICI